MDESTTTASSAEAMSDEQSQLETQQTQETAGSPTDEAQTAPSNGEVETVDANAETDEHIDWLKAKGIDPSDPQAVSKVAKMYREAEKQMHKTSQEAKNQLHTATQEAAQGDDIAELRSSVEVLQFYTANPEARDLDAEMAQIVTDKPWLAQDLQTVLTLAKAGKSDNAVKEAEERGRKAAKTEIARSSVASTPRGNASAATPELTVEEQRLERFSKWD